MKTYGVFLHFSRNFFTILDPLSQAKANRTIQPVLTLRTISLIQNLLVHIKRKEYIIKISTLQQDNLEMSFSNTRYIYVLSVAPKF